MSCCFRGNLNCRPSSECDNCGWNPAVEQKRIENLRSGKVKSYLHLNPKSYLRFAESNRRRFRKMKDEEDGE